MRDDQTPATKADITSLMSSIGKLYEANERWKDEILVSNERWKEELKADFRLVIEDLRHDFLGARRDKVESLDERTQGLDKRVTRLETRAGF